VNDEAEYFAERESVEQAMKKGDYRDKLIALRDFVAHELEGHRCKTCRMSQLRTGDTASLVLRLKTLLDDIEAIPDPNSGEVNDLERIRQRKASRAPAAPDQSPPGYGNFNSGS
jgi:hypothetical protein